MPDMSAELPPVGEEVIFERDADGVLLNGVRQEDGTWTMSLDDEDTTFDPATMRRWFRRSG